MTGIEVRQRSSKLLARGQSLLDKVVAPSTRQQFYDNVSTFAHEKPLLAAFVAIQFLLSAFFIAMFLSFVLSTVVFALGTAVLFVVFWIGVALLLLLPTLFITVSVGILVWIWAVSSFFAARWTYNMIPVNVRGNMGIEMPNGKTVIVNKTGNGYGDVEAKIEEPIDLKDF